MSLFEFLSDSVGNNLRNNPEDVRRTKRNFRDVGFFNDDPENDFITRDLDQGIRRFQRENDLREDGRLFPGGETERTLFEQITDDKADDVFGPAADDDNQYVGFGGNISGQLERPEKPKRNVQKAAAALPALAAELGLLLGMSAAAAWAYYQNLPDSQKKALRHRLTIWKNESAETDRESVCDKEYASDTERCNKTAQFKGAQAGAICHQSASERYAACLRGREKEDWPVLQR